MAHPGIMSASNPTYTAPHSAMMGGRGQPPPMGGYYHPAMAPGNGVVPSESPASGESPSPGSEDSNEDALARHNKRPSPDGGEVVPGGPGAGRGKKPKLSKKNKKKKDPNEPHKYENYVPFYNIGEINLQWNNLLQTSSI